MENLTDTQRDAVIQLQDLTQGGDQQTAIDILSSVEWDIQKAAELLFDNPELGNTSLSSPRRLESFQVDDSRQGQNRPPLSRSFRPNGGFIWSLFSYPLHLLSSIFRFIFGVLRIPVPQLRFTSLNFYRTLRPPPSNPRSAADRWVRALEEETGCVCINHNNDVSAGRTSGADTDPSTLTLRTSTTTSASKLDDARKLLPDFTIASYEEVLKKCQTETKIACVILVSEEHDDVAEFKRSTLTDSQFINALHENDIIVWGGDVRDQDAWSAAQKLQVTTYPFVAFLALQPRRSPTTSSSRSSGSPPTLTVLSRHQGRCIPESAPTSAQTLTEHLERQLLPRVIPFLERIQTSIREKERDRLLREEQDRAFQDSARKDRERILAKMAQEKEEAEERRQRAEEARILEQKRQTEEEERAEKAARQMTWRRWIRRNLVLPEPSDIKESFRIAIRLPSDKRVVRHFPNTAPLTALYAFADSHLIPQQFSMEDDPSSPPEGTSSGVAAISSQIQESGLSWKSWWGFTLVFAYPRREIKWDPSSTLASIDGLRGGAQIVVELGDSRIYNTATESDGYDTEDSE